VARRVLERIRELVRAGAYGLTIHALEELENDDLTAEDLEQVLCSGNIVERQWDAETGDRKYVIVGRCLSEDQAYAVVKFAEPVLTIFLA
jgi:hypothetical protein